LKLTSYYTARRRQLLCLSPKRNWVMTSSKSGHETTALLLMTSQK